MVISTQNSQIQSRKRQRSDVEELSSPSTIPGPVEGLSIPVRRHEELWFEDGNVILVANDGVGFRIYRGTLSRYSAVFKDMFKLPQPAEGETESSHGCAVVRLQDGSTELADLLRVLYEAGTSPLLSENTVAFRVISSCLRLGTKYDFEHVRSKALSRLEKCFPRTFSGWDSDFHRGDVNSPIELEDDDAICVVNLARSLQLPSILPSAMYACAQLSIHSLLHGITSSDGTFQRLSPEDLESCLNGREALLTKNIEVTACIVNAATSPSCMRKKDCASAMRELTQKAHQNMHLAAYDPLTSMMAWLKNHNQMLVSSPRMPVCTDCLAHLGVLEKSKQEAVWGELKGIFGLL